MEMVSVSRSLNTIFQPHSGRDSYVNYCIDISCTLSLSGGQTGTVFLEMSESWDFSTDIFEVTRLVNGNTGTLTVGLNITQAVTAQLCGMIPAAWYVRIRTANTTGSPSFAYRVGQETYF